MGSRPWCYLAIALGLILLLGALWLSPLGKNVSTGPTISAARESLLARLKGVIPPWGRVNPPDREKPPIAENPKRVNPPEGTTDTPPVNPITQPEPPSHPTSQDESPAVDTPPLAQPPDNRLQPETQPQATQKEPDDTGSFPLTISVSPGEDISDIALEIYGFANDELFDLIKRNNPDIPDLNAIQVGDKLVLPALPPELEKFRGS